MTSTTGQQKKGLLKSGNGTATITHRVGRKGGAMERRVEGKRGPVSTRFYSLPTGHPANNSKDFLVPRPKRNIRFSSPLNNNQQQRGGGGRERRRKKPNKNPPPKKASFNGVRQQGLSLSLSLFPHGAILETEGEAKGSQGKGAGWTTGSSSGVFGKEVFTFLQHVLHSTIFFLFFFSSFSFSLSVLFCWGVFYFLLRRSKTQRRGNHGWGQKLVADAKRSPPPPSQAMNMAFTRRFEFV
ncbi:hypothetical protein LX32DRAFT_13292 [Colletotrichum zoysiae]|uniref:Uncharacterized protein n=1 Tax=Colletotrichum zoysiae TaxID=1216348 RepID=A0AAD9HCU4_9PEZI|nr:hypothetical protein LX32DRAFT_13292 [Colletotrichum zoysiae]